MNDLPMNDETLLQILARQKDMNRREQKERRALLADHWLKFRVEREILAGDCIDAGGHEWTTTPNNGLHADEPTLGDPPKWCVWCGTHKRPWWMVMGEQ